MSEKNSNISNDLKGITSLTVDAIVAITDIAEALHHTIGSASWLFGAPKQDRASGITGMVYKNVRTITQLVGSKMDAPLDLISSMLEENDSLLARETILSVLNGVIGSHLSSQNNSLAIPMQFRSNGKPLNKEKLAEIIEKAHGKIVIMIHGSCMNDIQWKRKDHDHGVALGNDLGLAPIYLHYNTGLHISENGKQFSDFLENFISQLPKSIELNIVAHSMGGLVTRSACYYAEKSGYTWLDHLQKIVFLGTPHHGALLEKGGNLIDVILDINPYSAPFSRLGKLRSAGVTDLRYGNLLDEDWNENDRFKLSGDCRTPVPLPKDIKCYFIAVTTRSDSDIVGDKLIGDGLVTISSALGQHKDAKLNLEFPENHKWIGRNMNHLDLLNDPAVYEVIKNWLMQ